MALRDEICTAMEDFVLNAPAAWNVATVPELAKSLAAHEPMLLLDVREIDEFEDGHIPGAINVSVRELPKRLQELPEDRSTKIVAYCRSGMRSAYATMFLRVYGYSDVRNLEHGFQGWAAAGGEIVA